MLTIFKRSGQPWLKIISYRRQNYWIPMMKLLRNWQESWMTWNNSWGRHCIIPSLNKCKRLASTKLINYRKSIGKLIRVTKILLPNIQQLSLLLWTNFKLKLLRHFHFMINRRRMNLLKWQRNNVMKRQLKCMRKSKKRKKKNKLLLLKKQRKKEENLQLPNLKIQRRPKHRWSKEKKCWCRK